MSTDNRWIEPVTTASISPIIVLGGFHPGFRDAPHVFGSASRHIPLVGWSHARMTLSMSTSVVMTCGRVIRFTHSYPVGYNHAISLETKTCNNFTLLYTLVIPYDSALLYFMYLPA